MIAQSRPKKNISRAMGALFDRCMERFMLDEEKSAHLQVLLGNAKSFLARITHKAAAYTQHDYQWMLIILITAAILRFPFAEHPTQTMFDEVIYTNYALHTIHEQPFFDIHPPLARMLFADVARKHGPLHTWSLPMTAGQGFGDFPYATIRYFVACLGVLLPLLIYAIGRLLQYTPRVAAIPALFVLFDNALVIYSRAMLPDTPLLLLNFLIFASALAALSVKNRRISGALLIITGVTAGLALSLKWTALGVLATVFILFLSKRHWWAIVSTTLIAFIVYLSVFVLFFMHFPKGGPTEVMISSLDYPVVRNITFPNTEHITNVLHFIPSYNQIMLRVNADHRIGEGMLAAPRPIAWATAKGTIDFWAGGDGKKIKLQANSFLWILSFFLFIFDIGWIGWHMVLRIRQHDTPRWPIDRNEAILLFGYVMNYLPFFFIHRPMYLYHYFTAVIFLFLLVPKVAPRAIACLGALSRDRLFAQVFAGAILLGVFANFVLQLPQTYGF